MWIRFRQGVWRSRLNLMFTSRFAWSWRGVMSSHWRTGNWDFLQVLIRCWLIRLILAPAWLLVVVVMIARRRHRKTGRPTWEVTRVSGCRRSWWGRWWRRLGGGRHSPEHLAVVGGVRGVGICCRPRGQGIAVLPLRLWTIGMHLYRRFDPWIRLTLISAKKSMLTWAVDNKFSQEA